MSTYRITGLTLGVCLFVFASVLQTAPPPPRDSGPSRFTPPPPTEPVDPAARSPFGQTQPKTQPNSTDVKTEQTDRPKASKAKTEKTDGPKASKAKTTAPAKPDSRAAQSQAKPKANSKAKTKAPTPTRRPKIAAHTSAAAGAKASEAQASGENDSSNLSSVGPKFLVSRFDELPEKRGLAARHYPASNENRIDLFRKSISGLGGAYLGVGTDQNLTFIAWARSSHAYLMDFDPVSVGINKIHVFFLKRARNYGEFHRLWQPAHKKTSRALIRQHFKDDPYRPHVLRAFAVAHGRWSPVPARLRELKSFTKRFGLRSFHNDPEDYAYLRNMALAGRIQALPGDLRGATSMKAIHASALEIGIPIRVVYTSNAEDYFRVFPAGFRANLIDVPSDARSVILRTISRNNYIYGQPPGEKFPKRAPFHYNVQTLDSFKAWIQSPRGLSMHSIMPDRKQIRKGFSIIDTSPGGKQAGKTNESRKPAPRTPTRVQNNTKPTAN